MPAPNTGDENPVVPQGQTKRRGKGKTKRSAKQGTASNVGTDHRQSIVDEIDKIRHGIEGFEVGRHSGVEIGQNTRAGKYPMAATGNFEKPEFLNLVGEMMTGGEELEEDANEDDGQEYHFE